MRPFVHSNITVYDLATTFTWSKSERMLALCLLDGVKIVTGPECLAYRPTRVVPKHYKHRQPYSFEINGHNLEKENPYIFWSSVFAHDTYISNSLTRLAVTALNFIHQSTYAGYFFHQWAPRLAEPGVWCQY